MLYLINLSPVLIVWWFFTGALCKVAVRDNGHVLPSPEVCTMICDMTWKLDNNILHSLLQCFELLCRMFTLFKNNLWIFCLLAAMGRQTSALASVVLCWLWSHGCCRAVIGIVRSLENWAHRSAQRPVWGPALTDFTLWWAALRTELWSTSLGWRTKVRFY